jgi:cytochrome o ubiquinol oxidase subunit 2
MIMLDPAGIIASAEKNIIITAVLLISIVVVPVIIMTLVFAWRFRESAEAEYAPEWAHNVWLEIVWWSIPCVIIAILGTITWISCHTLDPFRPIESDETPLRIHVLALEWKWLFIYPDQHIASVNYLQIPVNVPVEFSITSSGPMNSFHIPQLGGQIYAMSGMESKLHLIANRSGDYRGLSANFSGDGFSDMVFTAHAGTKAEFEQWVASVKHSSSNLDLSAYNHLAKPGVNKTPVFYANADENLFDLVVMKQLSPISMEELAKRCSPTVIKNNQPIV